MSQIVKAGIMASAIMGISGAASALENGGSVYPHGVENFMAGTVPPHPGLYGMLYTTYYSADELTDNNGNKATAPPTFDVNVKVVAPRFAYVSDMDLMGGDVIFHTILPIVNVDAAIGAPGAVAEEDAALGDIVLGTGIAKHYSPSFHTVTALDVYLPTGKYDKARHDNTGKNHYGIEAVYALGLINPVGWNADARIGMLFNMENDDTNYESGDEFHFDYAAGWGFGNGWTLGVGGYYQQQINDDRLNGSTVADHRAHAFAIGPSIKYAAGKKWFVAAKFESEIEAKNRSKGEAFWIKFGIPLSVKH